MKESLLKIPVMITQPGGEVSIQNKGLHVEAVVDTGAMFSAVPRSIVETVYEGHSYPFGNQMIQHNHGGNLVQSTFLTLAVETTSSELIYAQIECLILDNQSTVLIGSDFLTQLGLQVTFDYKNQKVILQSYNWMTFEEEVATIYRTLGGTVKQNVNLAGLQIDLVVEEHTPSKQHFQFAVECKFYKARIGNRLVNDFSRVVATLKQAGLADKGVLVSSSGFTQDARLVAETSGIELITIDDLRQTLVARGMPAPILHPTKVDIQSPPAKRTPTSSPKVFVVMPFATDFDDIYHLGVREVVASIGGSCERADELQYVGGIIEKIYSSIKTADIIVAEVSIPNPNVYYEIGFAHALNIPVVLLTKDVKASPFDLRGYNHIVYTSIVELRQRLGRMLSQIIQK
jgi:predicted aspartyl protease